MSNFSTYDTQTDMLLANTSEIFYDQAMRMQAVNDTIRELLQRYDVPEMIKRDEITFDSDGLASKPADYYRMVKLWETNSSGIETVVYQYIQPTLYDKMASSSAYYWTEDYIVADTAIKLKILPIDSGTVDIRYVKAFTLLEDTTTDSGLSASWDEVVALGVTSRLLVMANRYDEAREYKALYERKSMDTFGALKNVGGIKGSPHLKSKWDRISLLGNFSNYDNTN